MRSKRTTTGRWGENEVRFVEVILPALILVHAVDDRNVAVNTEHIVSVAEPGDQFAKGVNCVISLVDRKFVSTREHCWDIWDKIQHEDAKEK